MRKEVYSLGWKNYGVKMGTGKSWIAVMKKRRVGWEAGVSIYTLSPWCRPGWLLRTQRVSASMAAVFWCGRFHGWGQWPGVRAVTGVTRLRAARVTGFDAVLEPPKAASKPSEFGCSNTKTPIIGSNIIN